MWNGEDFTENLKVKLAVVHKCFTLQNGQPVTKCDWVQYKERYLALSLSVFHSVKSTRKPDRFSIYMQKYRLIEHFFVIKNDNVSNKVQSDEILTLADFQKVKGHERSSRFSTPKGSTSSATKKERLVLLYLQKPSKGQTS